ncbi:hypothetical protein AUEXF2481DRAFT_263455 [Aureobasidium subglaciale EXF-2481]|uniref:Uncharacterized protein n=1 Tax=Aureobasidium subglaciale (strain EXF-2481) TaxID=1043005 RepID=A0A074YJJ2_AURSE|nr:uncharacterized protein AUEXF2481DRAFT_263455 [Aureobasidium subglaciale EXF-2481]KEQ94257.1 hypothetical protein AUEXF2481DRAFT_263455 [Aureobasidium subglaciale EXF-2481]
MMGECDVERKRNERLLLNDLFSGRLQQPFICPSPSRDASKTALPPSCMTRTWSVNIASLVRNDHILPAYCSQAERRYIRRALVKVYSAEGLVFSLAIDEPSMLDVVLVRRGAFQGRCTNNTYIGLSAMELSSPVMLGSCIQLSKEEELISQA